jgi:hypothetical protein
LIETPCCRCRPDLRDWVPADHLVHFVIGCGGAGSIISARRKAGQRKRGGTGEEQHPSGCCSRCSSASYRDGHVSSRQIERASYENVAVRLLCADIAI